MDHESVRHLPLVVQLLAEQQLERMGQWRTIATIASSITAITARSPASAPNLSAKGSKISTCSAWPRRCRPHREASLPGLTSEMYLENLMAENDTEKVCQWRQQILALLVKASKN